MVFTIQVNKKTFEINKKIIIIIIKILLNWS